MTYEQYITKAETAFRHLGSLGYRKGQVYMNMLIQERPDLAEMVRNLDPFYQDEKLSAFLDYIQEHWKLDNVLVGGSKEIWKNVRLDLGMAECHPEDFLNVVRSHLNQGYTLDSRNRQAKDCLILLWNSTEETVIVGNKQSINFIQRMLVFCDKV